MKKEQRAKNTGRADKLIGEAANKEKAKRIAPPSDMTKKEKQIWKGYVNSLPADYFFAHEIVVFTQYVRILSKMDDLTEVLATAEMTTIDDHGNERLNPALNAMKHLSAVQAVLARQLRLVTGTVDAVEQKRRGLKNEDSGAVQSQNKSKRSHLFGSRQNKGDDDE